MYVKSPSYIGASGSNNRLVEQRQGSDLEQHKTRAYIFETQVPLHERNPSHPDALTYFDIKEGTEFTVFIKRNNKSVPVVYLKGKVTTETDEEDTHDHMLWFRADLEKPDGQKWENKLCCMGIFGITKFDRPGFEDPEWNDHFYTLEGHYESNRDKENTVIFVGALVGNATTTLEPPQNIHVAQQ